MKSLIIHTTFSYVLPSWTNGYRGKQPNYKYIQNMVSILPGLKYLTSFLNSPVRMT